MQVLLLLHEVPFEMTCLLLFAFPNFLPKLKTPSCSLLLFCAAPVGGFVHILGWFFQVAEHRCTAGAVKPLESEHSLEQRSCGEAAVPAPSVTIINWDLPPSVLQILQPGPELPVLEWGLGFPLTQGCVECFKALSVHIWDLSSFFLPICLHLNQLEQQVLSTAEFCAKEFLGKRAQCSTRAEEQNYFTIYTETPNQSQSGFPTLAL